MATVQDVLIYDRPIGIGASRLQCVALIVSDATAGGENSISFRYQVQLAAGPPIVVVPIEREDWLALRAFRGLPTP